MLEEPTGVRMTHEGVTFITVPASSHVGYRMAEPRCDHRPGFSKTGEGGSRSPDQALVMLAIPNRPGRRTSRRSRLWSFCEATSISLVMPTTNGRDLLNYTSGQPPAPEGVSTPSRRRAARSGTCSRLDAGTRLSLDPADVHCNGGVFRGRCRSRGHACVSARPWPRAALGCSPTCGTHLCGAPIVMSTSLDAENDAAARPPRRVLHRRAPAGSCAAGMREAGFNVPSTA